MTLTSVVIVSTVIIVVFSIIVILKKPDQFWNWLITFVGTITSVMLGVVVGILLIEYSQDRSKHSEKERLSANLEAELSQIYNELSTGKKFSIKDKNGEQIEVLMVNINQITVDDAIRSNLFDNEATAQLIYISRNIKILDSSVDNLWAFLRIGGIFNTEYRMGVVRTSVSNIENCQKSIMTNIEKLEALLNKNFSKREHNHLMQPTAKGGG